METIKIEHLINLKVIRFEFDFSDLMKNSSNETQKKNTKHKISVPKTLTNLTKRKANVPAPPSISTQQSKTSKQLVEELLEEIYSDQKDWSSTNSTSGRGSITALSVSSCPSPLQEREACFQNDNLQNLRTPELRQVIVKLEGKLRETGEKLSRRVRTRDRLRRQQNKLCSAFTILLRHISGDHGARFSVNPGRSEAPGAGEGGYSEWLHAMRLVARLPAGVPTHFRRKLWQTLADRHLSARGVDWATAEGACFRGTALPDDTELGAQILKDLHRTGCSLFCGNEGRENQAMLRRVLLAYARWNKDVGYCQGFNMLAAIILEVMDKSEADSLKVMIYLVEAVLPEGYFSDDLRGLSADMAAFRDLLRLRIPKLAQHMDYLQKMSDGGGVEPPLPDVFTMQWFLTLYATWLPRESLLRIWDLILLDGNEILLLTALAIWDMLQDRILSARSADEYYSCMGGGASAVWQAGDALVARVVSLGSAPELPRLRDMHRYRVAPPPPPIGPPNYHPPLHSAMQTMTKKGLRLFYSEDEGESSDDGNKMALATVAPRPDERIAGDRLSLDIGALKRQYARLRERQRQAHVILAAACARHAAVGVPTSPTSLTVNNLLLGKSAIVSNRGRRLGPPVGAVPPSRYTTDKEAVTPDSRSEDTISWNEDKQRKTLSRRNSVKWRDIKKEKETDQRRKSSIDLDEVGDGVIVSEYEANQMIASIRSRTPSGSSTYSTRSSSSDTSLCDDNAKESDSEMDMPYDNNTSLSKTVLKPDVSPQNPVLTNNDNVLSPIVSKNKTEIKNVNNDISKYIQSSAGEQLRTYLDGFEHKLMESVTTHSHDEKILCFSTPRTDINNKESNNETEQNSNKLNNENANISEESLHLDNVQKSPIRVTDLSPIKISPCLFRISNISPQNYEIRYNENSHLTRSPDLIESYTMCPDFVPEIDLNDNTVCDFESLPRSPGADSIAISEDETPIPLQIDEYFENSPDFFGARITVTDPENTYIPSRRPHKRFNRPPKKPDSLTLKYSHNEELQIKDEPERALSLPHSLSDSKSNDKSITDEYSIAVDDEFYLLENSALITPKVHSSESLDKILPMTPKDYILQSGRKNSERALEIIQENSKILKRILTKQTEIKPKASPDIKSSEFFLSDFRSKPEFQNILSPLLRESTSDSLLGQKVSGGSNVSTKKIRPVSLDDPFSFETKLQTILPSPRNEVLENKTDVYGWENKGFLAKTEYIRYLDKTAELEEIVNVSNNPSQKSETRESVDTPDWKVIERSKESITLPSTDFIDSFSNKYTVQEDVLDPIESASRRCDLFDYKPYDFSKTGDNKCNLSENVFNSQVSDFANLVTSSISFSYERSADDDSPIGAKSNSSDTLCQITSLDQISTPISPKLFPKDTPTMPKDYAEKSDKLRYESDDTCSTITSLIETDTLSSLSYPRSPSSGSHHPFPTRPPLRGPKELAVRLGMYPKDTTSSPK